MGRPVIPLCGFAHVILYLNAEDFWNYAIIMKDQKHMIDAIKEATYRTEKFKQKKLLTNP